MAPDWLDAFLIFGLFKVVEIMGLALLVHIQLGMTRVANFGVVGFWGLGLYVFGVAYVQYDWPFDDPFRFLAAAALATLAGALAGGLVGWFIADLDDDGTLVGTLGFAKIVVILAVTQKELTGGAIGLGGIRFPYDFGSTQDREFLWLLLTGVVVAAIFWYAQQLHKKPYGRLLIAVGANEPLARSLGKSTKTAKLRMMIVTSAAMGFLGAMHGVMVRSLEIGSLDVGVTLAALAALILGGTARVWGAVIGVILTLAFFDIVVQFYLPLPQEWNTQALPVAREAIFGLVLVLILIFRPQGLLGQMQRPKLMRGVHSDY